MQREQIAFVGTSDFSGHFRGKSFLAADLPAKLERGVGLAPTNLFLSAFGTIPYTPFGTQGEVFMVPDPETRVYVPRDGDGPAEFFFIGDLRDAEGAPWSYCPRQILRRALERLYTETALRLYATFEQEFIYSGVPAHPPQPYALDAYRRQGGFGEALVAALRLAGVTPDSFLAEFGPQQYEITTAPAIGLRAADDAVITREIVQAVAHRFGARAGFTPIPTPAGVSNGTHIHWSFLDSGGQPVLHVPGQPFAMSELGRHFCAGILHHLPALCAVTAPSVASYYRLRPNHWAPVLADIGDCDRGTSIRVSPLAPGGAAHHAGAYNLEFRVADATASPYLALAMRVQAGLEGVRERRDIDPRSARPLPQSLSAALTLLETTPVAAEWLGAEVLAAYLRFKRAEIATLEPYDETEICLRYAEAY